MHSRRQKAVAEIVAERLHVSDLEKYVDSEYSGRYVDAILCEELKSSMLDVIIGCVMLKEEAGF